MRNINRLIALLTNMIEIRQNSGDSLNIQKHMPLQLTRAVGYYGGTASLRPTLLCIQKLYPNSDSKGIFAAFSGRNFSA